MFARILAALVAVCVCVGASTVQAQQSKGVACKRDSPVAATLYIMALNASAGTATVAVERSGRPDYFSGIKGTYINGRLKFRYLLADFDVEVRSDSLVGDAVGYGPGVRPLKGVVWHCDGSPLQLAQAR